MVDVTGFLLDGERDNVADCEKEKEWTWSAFCRRFKALGHEVRGEPGEYDRIPEWKAGLGHSRPPAIWPVEADFDVDPLMALNREAEFVFREIHADKDAVARRAKHSVSGAYACWLDMDDLSAESFERLEDFLDEGYYDAFIYSSYNHGRKKGVYKIRLVLRLNRRQTADEIDSVRRGAAKVLRVNADKACIGRHTLFYLPAVHPDWAQHAFFKVFEGGEAFDVDELIEEDPDLFKEMAKREIDILRTAYNGEAPTTDQMQLARGALDELCNGIAFFLPGPNNLLRPLTELASMKIGQYVAAGALELEGARARLHRAMRELWDAQLRGVDKYTLEFRINQIDKGLRDGARRPMLPPTAKKVLEEDEIEAKLRLKKVRLQMLKQAPAGAVVSVDEARRLLNARTEAFSRSFGRGDLLGAVVPAGVGKSTNQAHLATTRARVFLQTVIVTQEHAVADQTRKLLGDGVRSCHKFSALAPPPGMESQGCPRKDELADYIHETGISLRKICATQCSLAETCPALAAARERDQAEKEAMVLFVSQAGCHQALDWFENGALPMFDEQPAAWDRQLISRKDLGELYAGVPCLSLDGLATLRAAVMQMLAGIVPPEPLTELGEVPLDVYHGMTAAERRKHRQARVVVKAALSRSFERLEDGSIQVWKRTPAQEMLETYGGILSDATPVMASLPKETEVFRLWVQDSAPVERLALIPGGRDKSRSRGSLEEAIKDPTSPKIKNALARCFMAARTHQARKVLFVSFKSVVVHIDETHRAFTDSWGLEAFSTAYHGALRGKNQWQDYDMVYVLGKPLQDRKELCEHLLGPDATEAEIVELWESMARDDNEQAVARGRPTSRSKPLLMEDDSDDSIPSGWHDAELTITADTAWKLFEMLRKTGWTNKMIAEGLSNRDGRKLTESAVKKWVARVNRALKEGKDPEGIPEWHTAGLLTLLGWTPKTKEQKVGK